MSKKLAAVTMSIIIGVLFLCIAIPAWSQVAWKPTNQVTVGWDAVAPIAAGDVISYKVYSKAESAGSGVPPTFMIATSATQTTVTFQNEGKYFLGVSTIRSVGGAEVESSTICWSNDNTCTFQGQAFGIYYIIPPQSPKNFRAIN